MLVFSKNKISKEVCNKTSFGGLSNNHGSSWTHQTAPKDIARTPIRNMGSHVRLWARRLSIFLFL